MPGVRIHHPALRNCTYTVVHFGRPYQAPVNCWVCQQVHLHKTYHLALDGMGDVVVSETIYERLKEADLGELKVLGQENNPEPQVIDTGAAERPLVVSREAEGS